jgi:hypothetical protein
MITAGELASRMASILRNEKLPGYLVAFDGETFVGLLPITRWRNCFSDALAIIPFDRAAVIILDDPPPPELLQAAAEQCSVTFDGAVHARPIRLLHVTAPPAKSARVLH